MDLRQAMKRVFQPARRAFLRRIVNNDHSRHLGKQAAQPDAESLVGEIGDDNRAHRIHGRAGRVFLRRSALGGVWRHGCCNSHSQVPLMPSSRVICGVQDSRLCSREMSSTTLRTSTVRAGR